MVLIATSVLGWVVGWLMGQNGPDDTVLAAVLPAVVSAGGLLILQKIVSFDDYKKPILLSLIIIGFSSSLYAGTVMGAKGRIETARETAREYAEEQEKLKITQATQAVENKRQYFIRCSEMEFDVNRRRRFIDLEPLPAEYFCKEASTQN